MRFVVSLFASHWWFSGIKCYELENILNENVIGRLMQAQESGVLFYVFYFLFLFFPSPSFHNNRCVFWLKSKLQRFRVMVSGKTLFILVWVNTKPVKLAHTHLHWLGCDSNGKPLCQLRYNFSLAIWFAIVFVCVCINIVMFFFALILVRYAVTVFGKSVKMVSNMKWEKRKAEKKAVEISLYFIVAWLSHHNI